MYVGSVDGYLYAIGGYAIYKGTSSGGESLTPISTVGATVTTWTDTSVVLGSTYYYYIKAYDTGSPPNYSTPSGEVPPYQVAGAIRDDGMVPAESAQLPGVPNIDIYYPNHTHIGQPSEKPVVAENFLVVPAKERHPRML